MDGEQWSVNCVAGATRGETVDCVAGANVMMEDRGKRSEVGKAKV